MKKIIIFDMDGVLFNTEPVCFAFNQESFPGLTYEMMSEVLCGNFHEEIARVMIPRVVESSEERDARVKVYREKKTECPLFDGIFELLSELHSGGYTIALNTSARDEFCLPLLERADVFKFFDFLGTKEVSNSKADKFKLIQEKYNAHPEDMIFITDTLGDVREAQVAGVPTIAVTYGAHKRSHFTREPVKTLVAIIDSVSELKPLLLK
jgi:phosphoglycolate phosphatase